MRKLVFLVLWAAIVLPAFAAKRAATQMVTVEQLEQTLAHVQGKRDGPLAKRISNMKLTERFSDSRLAHLEKELPGRQSREELSALAGESAFLDLPTAEIPFHPAPSSAEQAALLARSVNYVNKTVAQWPSFTATRWTTRFEGTATVIPADLQDWLFSLNSPRSRPVNRWNCPGQPKVGYRRLSVIDRSSVTLVNRNGHELVALDESGGEFACPKRSVSTSEEFADVLAWVPRVISQGTVAWSHWEQGAPGLLAVFRYSATVSIPPSSGRKKDPPILIETRGEFALNPADGSVARLTEIRRWRESVAGVIAVLEYDTMVEYAPVAIGESVCLCPARRVAIFLAPALWPKGTRFAPLDDELYRRFHLSASPLEEYLNDVTFGQYQLYGSRAPWPPVLK